MAKALVIGATGLVGRELIDLLINDIFFTEIEIWVRKPTYYLNPRIREIIFDFETVNSIPKISHDVVFCCIGSTIKKSGSKENFRKIDYDIVVNIAHLAERSDVTNLIVISSLGASSLTNNFYLKTKGEMEDSIGDLVIPSISILRPSVLIGNRLEFRLGETIAIFVLKLFGVFLFGGLRKYRGIEASKVAQAMINLTSNEWIGINILESDEIERIAKL